MAPGYPTMPPVDDTLMIEQTTPAGVRRIERVAACMPRKHPSWFTATTFKKSSTVASSTPPAPRTAALFTSTPMGPNTRSVSSTAVAQLVGSLTSRWT